MSEASNNLRHWAALTRMSGYNISADDFEAAADEIERLRGYLDLARINGAFDGHPDQAEICDYLDIKETKRDE